MICIPIGAGTNAELLSLIRRAETEPADIYELRLDRLEERAKADSLVAACSRPVMATCRSVPEGGCFRGDAAARRKTLREAAAAGAAYLDCEAADVESLRDLPGVTLIASMHDFAGVPEDLERRISLLEATDADWVKFAVAATRLEDNLRVFAALGARRKPAIGIAMGEAGLVSRVLGRRFGSRVAFASLDAGLESAPGQIGVRELTRLYRCKRIDENTALYGVLGLPGSGRHEVMAGNLSFIDEGRNAVCLPFHAENAPAFLAVMPDALGLRGLTVAEPHRKAALEWANRATDGAMKAKRADTLLREHDGWTADFRGENAGCCFRPAAGAEMATPA